MDVNLPSTEFKSRFGSTEERFKMFVEMPSFCNWILFLGVAAQGALAAWDCGAIPVSGTFNTLGFSMSLDAEFTSLELC